MLTGVDTEFSHLRKQLRYYNYNASSIVPKFDELYALITTHILELACIVETLPSGTILDFELK